MPLLILFFLFIPTIAFGADPVKYKPLIEGIGLGGEGSFDAFINQLYVFSITLAALLAVIKIIVAGVKYSLTDIVTGKGDAKSEIRGALLGLLIVMGAVLILEVINPQLVNINFNPEPIEQVTYIPPVAIASTDVPAEYTNVAMGIKEKGLCESAGGIFVSEKETCFVKGGGPGAEELSDQPAWRPGGTIGAESGYVAGNAANTGWATTSGGSTGGGGGGGSTGGGGGGNTGGGGSNTGGGNTGGSGCTSTAEIECAYHIPANKMSGSVLQETLTIPKGKVLVSAITTNGDSTKAGNFSYETPPGAVSPNTNVWISATPNGAPLQSTRCHRDNVSFLYTISYTQVPGNEKYRCMLQLNTTYYVNMKHVYPDDPASKVIRYRK